MWPTAVVVTDQVLVSDVCQLRGLDASLSESLAKRIITESPVDGGTKIVHMQMIRDALAAGGANLATLVVSGAKECTVSRPASAQANQSRSNEGTAAATSPASPNREIAQPQVLNKPDETHQTLREAVTKYFNRETGHLGGYVEVEFDRTSGAALDLSGPDLEFVVRRRTSSRPELTSVEVDVVRDSQIAQTVSLTVRTTLHRQVVVAVRAINQGATIRAADVELKSMTFTRFENVGLPDLAQCIGQRAKRFIAEDSVIEPAAIEGVPLVARGQLVTLTSVCGAIRVVSSGRAEREGHLGEVITLRAVDDSKSQFDGVVVGPGKVELVSDPVHTPSRMAERTAP